MIPNVERLDRRHFLGAAALGAAGLGLAACGDGGGGGSPSAEEVPGPEPNGQVVQARDAVLPAPSEESTINLTLEAQDVTYEVAAGVRYNAWTYGGQVPAPVIHMRQGDTMNFKLVNHGALGNSIDFHAAQLDWAVNYKTIDVGQSIEFQWPAMIPLTCEPCPRRSTKADGAPPRTGTDGSTAPVNASPSGV